MATKYESLATSEDELETGLPARTPARSASTTLRVVTAAALAVSVLSLVFSTSAAQRTLASVRGLSVDSRPCDPFALPGILNVSLSALEDVTWQPFETSACPHDPQDIHLWPGVRAALENDSISDVELRDRYSWLANKTIVAVGDSVDRSVAPSRITTDIAVTTCATSACSFWASRS